MPYLSRLYLNLGNPAVRRDLARPYELHRTLWQALPDAADGGAGRVLFRVDADRCGRHVALVQSEKEPDWDRLPPGYLAADADTKSLDELQFAAGQRLRFRLRANPTKKVETLPQSGKKSATPRRNGRRVAFVREDDQIDWLANKGRVQDVSPEPGRKPAVRVGGFRLVTVRPFPERPEPVYGIDPRPDGWVRDKKKDKESARVLDISCRAVLFDGVLEVTDPVAFRNTLAAGVGPGKGFGFGLLSVAPARD
jgi:CRISPR system Cascade subunit CasE